MARLLVIVMWLSLSLSVNAQSIDRFEIFGGYSYFNGSSTVEGIFPHDHSGWNVSATGKINRWVGITADFSGYPQSDEIGDSANVYYFLFGPTASLTFHRFTPFVHFLVGDSHVSPSGVSFLTSNNSFAYAAGGGLDYSLVNHIALRVQVDRLHNGLRTNDNQLQNRVNQNFPRISTGLVFRF